MELEGITTTKLTDSFDATSKSISILSNLSTARAKSNHATQTILFSLFDYALFVALFGLSMIIGIYYGFFSKHKQNTTSEYILGGKTMKILPVAISLVAAFISGFTLLGVPVEVYLNGTQYAAFPISVFIAGVAAAYVFLPLFHSLKMTSIFEYLERRFDRMIRLLASAMYVMLYMSETPFSIFLPALAFSQVTGYNSYLIIPIVCIVCISYTAIGGFRAVVWTDFIQFVVLLVAVIAIIALGTIEAGGIFNVWAAANRGQRLILFNLDPSPFARTSFWTVLFGLTFEWIASVGVGQSRVQRFFSVPDLKAAQKCVFIFVIGIILIKLFAIYIGLCLYAKYEHCDPVESGKVLKPDQIFPYYIVEVGRKIPGLPGLFIAGLFASSLATMSAALNTLSGIIYEDFFKHHMQNASEKRASAIMRLLTVILGIIMTLLAFFVDKLGTAFQVLISLNGTTSGAFLGLFTIGMISRSANTKGVLIGSISSIATVGAILIGAQTYNVSKELTLPIHSDQCPNEQFNHMEIKNLTSIMLNASASRLINSAPKPVEVFWLFRFSFMYYSTIGFIVMMSVSYVVSVLTGGGSKKVDESLLMPLFQSKRFKDNLFKNKNKVEYATIKQEVVEIKNEDTSDDAEVEK